MSTTNTFHKNKRLRITANNESNISDDSDNEQEMLDSDQNTNTKVPPLLIQDAKELKDNAMLLKQAISQDLNGMEINQIKFTKNNNMLLYLKYQRDYDQLASEDSNATLGGKEFIILKPKLYPFVIKGINYNNAKVLTEELNELGIVNMKEIKSARNKDAIINKVILFCDNEQTATNHKNKGFIYLSYQKHKTEEYKPAIRLTSCFKCQKFGHIAKQCRADKTVCPKCGKDDHEKDEQNKLVCNEEKKHCINCGQEHSSAYAGCPKKKKILQDLKNKQKEKTHNPQITNTPKQVSTNIQTINSKVSYASILANSTQKQHTNITEPQFEEIANQNRTIELLTSKVNELEEKLEKANEQNAQLASALQKINDIETNQEEVSNKFCISLIDLYHILAQKSTYTPSTVQVIETLIRQTGNKTITQSEINKRLTEHARELKKSQKNNSQTQSSITSLHQASSTQPKQTNQTDQNKAENRRNSTNKNNL